VQAEQVALVGGAAALENLAVGVLNVPSAVDAQQVQPVPGAARAVGKKSQ
jgi:hypothetical protein